MASCLWKTKMDSKFICLFTFTLVIANWKLIIAQTNELICQNEKIPNSFQNGIVYFRMKKAVVPFIGRNFEIDQIENEFQNAENQVLVIHGPRGIGKTELARKLAEIFKTNDENCSTIWIDGESMDSIVYFFQELANFIGLNTDGKIPSEIFEEVFKSIENKKALFIFDDTPNNIYVVNSIQKFLPADSEIKILITSENDAWRENFKLLPLSAFSEENSIEFLTKNLHLTPENVTDAKKLASVLQHVPLALSKAAKYIKDQNYSLEDFLEDYKDHFETNIPSTTLDPLEEILRQEEANPKPVGDSTNIFEDLGLKPVHKVILVEKVRPPTSAELRNAVQNKAKKEARRASKNVRNFFQRLRNDIG